MQPLRAPSVSQRRYEQSVRSPLRVILNGLGKDAAQIISRINGFTYVETKMNYYTGEVEEVFRKCYSSDPESPRAKVLRYGANDVTEGVWHHVKEGVEDVSITGKLHQPYPFQHPVAGTYKKECVEKGKKYFSVASAAAQAVPSIPTIWRLVRLPTE